MGTNNSINLSGSSGVVNFNGSSIVTTTALTQYYTLVGSSSNTITCVSPGSSGYVLTSNGSSNYPSYQSIPYIPLSWSDKSTSFSATVSSGYFITGTATATLPPAPTPVMGSTISYAVDGAVVLTLLCSANQYIRIGKSVSLAAGTALSSGTSGDSITLVYRSTDSTWIATQVVGLWTVTTS